jgi:ABC-type transporter Mla maintaining outer membrane lipid asymmetry ATPase subunit MlaF
MTNKRDAGLLFQRGELYEALTLVDNYFSLNQSIAALIPFYDRHHVASLTDRII